MYVTFRVVEAIRPVFGHGGHLTGVGAEAKVMNSGRVPGEVKGFRHVLELALFEYHFEHVDIRCEAFRAEVIN